MIRLDADWITEDDMILLLGIDERRGGNADELQKGIRYFQVDFGSVVADAGHDVFLTVSYNPLSNCRDAWWGHKFLLDIAKPNSQSCVDV